MARYHATVNWEAKGSFRDGGYSRAHRWQFDGGASVPASSSPNVVPLPWSDPAGVDPEEALVASVASCHMLWFLALAQKAGFDVASYRDTASGAMGRDERGKISVTRIELSPDIRFNDRQPTRAEMAELHHQAHENCFIANSLRTEIIVREADRDNAAA